MLSKNQIKFIRQLSQKKYRLKNGLFVVEGVKSINELLHSTLNLYQLYTTESFNFNAKKEILISQAELKKISFLTTPNTAIALFKIPDVIPVASDDLIIALDDVRDPGNLGTIIRLCDWFGVKHLVCSKHTVDCFNPKVLQATMGSITRVNVSYLDLDFFLTNTELTVFGAFMDGNNVYQMALPKKGVLVMGNEANGISKNIEHIIHKRITISRFGKLKTTESLNVATATAIMLHEFRRNV